MRLRTDSYGATKCVFNPIMFSRSASSACLSLSPAHDTLHTFIFSSSLVSEGVAATSKIRHRSRGRPPDVRP